MLLAAGHPEYAFNLADPSTVIVEIRAYSNTEFGFYLAHMLCAWCAGPLFVSYPSLYILVYL